MYRAVKILLCALPALTASAMGEPESEESLRTVVSSHLDPASARRLIRIVDDVGREGRDARPLENKIREGIAKGASGPAIVRAAALRTQRLARIEKGPDVRSQDARDVQRSLYALERTETRRRGMPDRARFTPRNYRAIFDERSDGRIWSTRSGFGTKTDRGEGFGKHRSRSQTAGPRRACTTKRWEMLRGAERKAKSRTGEPEGDSKSGGRIHRIAVGGRARESLPR